MADDPAVQTMLAAQLVHWNDDGNCACGRRGDGDTELHIAMAYVAALRPIIEAEALNRMADDLGKNVACPDCLRARAAVRTEPEE